VVGVTLVPMTPCTGRARWTKQPSLFHHDPDHNDAKIAEMVARAQREVEKNKSSLHVAAACEGAEVRLTLASG
jgi:hypothetical protein